MAWGTLYFLEGLTRGSKQLPKTLKYFTTCFKQFVGPWGPCKATKPYKAQECFLNMY